ncbi:hypothetical protein [Thiomonas sp. X19]|uniref:hypothetical protein n=1 Tax=Thiomonas sp. X19 TaxID=1050370 RepID=UPI000DD9396A|nr:hypothetical protein [Thiomonas sp. X19]
MLLTLASRIPWWADVLLAAGAYVLFDLFGAHLAQHVAMAVPNDAAAAHAAMPVTAAVNAALAHAWVPAVEIFAKAFQYLIPAFFLIGGLVSFFKSRGSNRCD